jgi:prophage DNA circulation protein
MLDQLLESARLASQRRSNLLAEFESLRRRVGALEEGHSGATENIRAIIDRLASTLPVQNQLNEFSGDLSRLSATLTQEFGALSPRLSALEAAQTKTVEDVAQMQRQLEAAVPEQDQLIEMSSALRTLSANLTSVSKPSDPVPDPGPRLTLIEQQIANMTPALQRMETVCLELRKLLNP